ncbi:ATP-binding protein [Streptomyces sp. NBC_00140]|uniref:ATP-binding protein n=1 Tax=Streptomyces sp. NBC_00140 TaxID=2975664 RepID=UPI00224CBE14|nr:ATP-binding protein [Streptomyces sp. NBC_00140]MCX5336869.1 ATP-binding protein [Streptomyces sp. NBC_00140]
MPSRRRPRWCIHEPLHDGGLRRAEQARDVARGFLLVAAPDGGSAVDAVLLVVSELFANAVQHAGGVTGFRLEAGAGTVTVAVHDASPLPPRPLPMDATKPGGFGWHLVQELSVDVRVQPPLQHKHTSPSHRKPLADVKTNRHRKLGQKVTPTATSKRLPSSVTKPDWSAENCLAVLSEF